MCIIPMKTCPSGGLTQKSCWFDVKVYKKNIHLRDACTLSYFCLGFSFWILGRWLGLAWLGFVFEFACCLRFYHPRDCYILSTLADGTASLAASVPTQRDVRFRLWWMDGMDPSCMCTVVCMFSSSFAASPAELIGLQVPDPNDCSSLLLLLFFCYWYCNMLFLGSKFA